MKSVLSKHLPKRPELPSEFGPSFISAFHPAAVIATLDRDRSVLARWRLGRKARKSPAPRRCRVPTGEPEAGKGLIQSTEDFFVLGVQCLEPAVAGHVLGGIRDHLA